MLSELYLFIAKIGHYGQSKFQRKLIYESLARRIKTQSTRIRLYSSRLFAVLEILKFLRDFIFGSKRSLDSVTFYMQVSYTAVPYNNDVYTSYDRNKAGVHAQIVRIPAM